jgi:hypothetical protein
LRQKRLAAAATSRPEMTSSISTPGEALNVAVASPDQVGKRVKLFTVVIISPLKFLYCVILASKSRSLHPRLRTYTQVQKPS